MVKREPEENLANVPKRIKEASHPKGMTTHLFGREMGLSFFQYSQFQMMVLRLKPLLRKYNSRQVPIDKKDVQLFISLFSCLIPLFHSNLENTRLFYKKEWSLNPDDKKKSLLSFILNIPRDIKKAILLHLAKEKNICDINTIREEGKEEEEEISYFYEPYDPYDSYDSEDDIEEVQVERPWEAKEKTDTIFRFCFSKHTHFSSKKEKYDREESAEEIAMLAGVFKVHRYIRDVHFDNNYLFAGGARALSEALFYNPHIETISLENNILGNNGADWVAISLAGSQKIRHLNLSENYINASGWYSLVNALLSRDCGLEVLDISDNYILDEEQGLKDLARLILHNQSLKKISIANNMDVDNQNMKLLLPGLKSNIRLKKIDLCFSSVNEEGIQCFIKALETKNICLIEIHLMEYGLIHDATKAKLEILLLRNRTIKMAIKSWVILFETIMPNFVHDPHFNEEMKKEYQRILSLLPPECRLEEFCELQNSYGKFARAKPVFGAQDFAPSPASFLAPTLS